MPGTGYFSGPSGAATTAVCTRGEPKSRSDAAEPAVQARDRSRARSAPARSGLPPASARQHLKDPQHGDEEQAAHQNRGAEGADDHARLPQPDLDPPLVTLVGLLRVACCCVEAA